MSHAATRDCRDANLSGGYIPATRDDGNALRLYGSPDRTSTPIAPKCRGGSSTQVEPRTPVAPKPAAGAGAAERRSGGAGGDERGWGVDAAAVPAGVVVPGMDAV